MTTKRVLIITVNMILSKKIQKLSSVILKYPKKCGIIRIYRMEWEKYMKKNTTLTIRGEYELLSLEEKKEINRIKDSINLSYKEIYNYASDVSKNMKNFSSAILRLLSRKNISNIDNLLADLTVKISKIDTKRILKGNCSLQDIRIFIEEYNEISNDLVKVKSSIKTVVLELQKEVELCNRYLEQNMEYVNLLDKYVLAGRLKVAEVEDELSFMNGSGDSLNEQLVLKKRNDLEQLVNKLQDLATLRLIAVQNIPMIGIIQQGDYTLIEKMNQAIDRTIPVWETQTIVAIAIAYQKSGISSCSSVEETLSKVLKMNSGLVKKSAVALAKDIDSKNVSVRTLYNGTKDTLNAINILKNTKLDNKDEKKINKQIQENEKVREILV